MNIFVLQAIIILGVNHLWFLYAVLKKRNDYADVVWGLNFIIVAATSLAYDYSKTSLVLFSLVAIWGFRLSGHILKRYVKKNSEDSRYAKWRKDWGKKWLLLSWAKVFLLQGFFLYIISLPLITTAYSSATWKAASLIGVAVWIFGYGFETLADRQLRNFLKDKSNQGRIMQSGLWKYSRHPNYFGEAVMWWGIWLITWGTPFFWLNIISPLTITFLLRFVSGVPLAEAGFKDNQEFQAYKKKTPSMLPNFFVE